jgi:phage-related baseplate assembly protein
VFLDAKLSIPQSRSAAGSRDAPIEKARSSSCRVVAITTPANAWVCVSPPPEGSFAKEL